MTHFLVESENDNYPYSAVVKILSTFADGSTDTGSGVMVGANDVLTAAHCLWKAGTGAATSVIVMPGYDRIGPISSNDDVPFGSHNAVQWSYYEWDTDRDGLLVRSEGQYDVGIISFARNDRVGDLTGWFGMDPQGERGTFHLTGYPNTYEGARMTDDIGHAFENANYRVMDFQGDLESVPGNSGGPLWYMGADGPYVVGVCSSALWAADIDKTYDQLLTWIRQDGVW